MSTLFRDFVPFLCGSHQAPRGRASKRSPLVRPARSRQSACGVIGDARMATPPVAIRPTISNRADNGRFPPPRALGGDALFLRIFIRNGAGYATFPRRAHNYGQIPAKRVSNLHYAVADFPVETADKPVFGLVEAQFPADYQHLDHYRARNGRENRQANYGVEKGRRYIMPRCSDRDWPRPGSKRRRYKEPCPRLRRRRRGPRIRCRGRTKAGRRPGRSVCPSAVSGTSPAQGQGWS